MTAPIDLILPLLTKVRPRRPGQWSACCPAHEDKSPSLSVLEFPDGGVTFTCFAGCSKPEIVAALGMDMAALYPPRAKSGREPQRQPRLLTAGQALELLDNELNLVAVAAGNLHNGVKLTQSDLDRLLVAAGRVSWLREQSRGGAHHA
jgi:hypothetical protein